MKKLAKGNRLSSGGIDRRKELQMNFYFRKYLTHINNGRNRKFQKSVQ